MPRPCLHECFFPWSCLWTHAHGELPLAFTGISWKTMALWSPLCLKLDDKTTKITGALLAIALPVAAHGAEPMQASLRGAHPPIRSLIEIRVKFIEISVKFCLGCSRAFSSSSQTTTWLVFSQRHWLFLLKCLHHL